MMKLKSNRQYKREGRVIRRVKQRAPKARECHVFLNGVGLGFDGDCLVVLSGQPFTFPSKRAAEKAINHTTRDGKHGHARDYDIEFV